MNKIALSEAGDDLPDAPSGREEEPAPGSFGEPDPETPSPATPAAGWLGACWKVLQSPLANLVGPVITLLFALIAVAIIREAFRDVVVIRPIGVPAALADEGYSSSIVSQRLLDQIALINRQNEIVSRPFLKKGRSFYTELREVDVQLPGLGLSLRSALSYLRSTFGAGETEVGGEIIQQDDKRLVLRLRVSSQGGPFLDIPSSEGAGAAGGGASSLDDVLRTGAIQTVRALDSYALAIYYLGKDQSKVPEIVQYCEDYDPSCRPWSALLRGLVFSNRHDWTAAAAGYQAAIAEFRFPANAWPAYGMAYVYLADIERSRSARDDREANEREYAEAMGMFRKAIWLFEHHGRAVDPYDQFYIGHIYQMGYSVGPYNRPDCGQAERWYRQAAARGSALAQNSLGDLHNPRIDKGGCDGLPEQGLEEARSWYGQAAKGGQVYAQRRLGEIYKAGLGLEGGSDPALAIYYLKEAAERGDAIALTDLGEIYQDGAGGPPDWIRAYAWFALAAEAQGETSALGKASGRRDAAASHMTAEDQAQAVSLVREWKLGRRGGL
jgi:TPR repeat protein